MTTGDTPLPVELGEHEITVDARLIADGFDLDPSAVLTGMRDGTITSLCERGSGEDAGRFRLTFFYRSRRCRFVVDRHGRVLRRSMLDFGDRPVPTSLRTR